MTSHKKIAEELAKTLATASAARINYDDYEWICVEKMDAMKEITSALRRVERETWLKAAEMAYNYDSGVPGHHECHCACQSYIGMALKSKATEREDD